MQIIPFVPALAAQIAAVACNIAANAKRRIGLIMMVKNCGRFSDYRPPHPVSKVTPSIP